MPAAVVSSTSKNAVSPKDQPDVKAQGEPVSSVDDTATITSGSATVFVNSKAAARNADKAKTWDYSVAPPPPDTGREIENGAVVATGNVFIG